LLEEEKCEQSLTPTIRPTKCSTTKDYYYVGVIAAFKN